MKAFFKDLNTVVDVTLLGGLILSVSIIIASLVWQWLSSGTLGFFPAIPARNLLEYLIYTFRNASSEGMGPTVLANAGIAVLLLTPFMRVLASALFFGLYEHNRIYTAITAFVLAFLGIVLFVV
jgi:uncharacterized membrane protein